MHALLVLNGSVFGISGFLHRAVRCNTEAIMAVAGLSLGGACVGFLQGPGDDITSMQLPKVLLSGFLVGIGTRMSNGCTSGHMLAGISRLSPRSIVATCIFFTAGVLTTRSVHPSLPPHNYTRSHWILSSDSRTLVAVAASTFSIPALLYLLSPEKPKGMTSQLLRILAVLSTSFAFSVALHLSGLSDPQKVFSFLVLPIDESFDPSLAYLAAGALPLLTFLYQSCRGSEMPRLGGSWSVPKGGHIDPRLIAGASLFGVGWGMSGLCPGPAVVNLGRALVTGVGLLPILGWLGTFVTGGLLV